ncbi:hypothetical protein [Streptomonospora salina]|uniref:Uncharacterized protein n=1 Tax=Streptomonospora salina TaxID=104205 RepID=A0A841E513_9ACTN|nr:hypothetical protein [Streptomonospora salina]MBB5998225.1 hypothetical protein [Streptomonospora salina]
MSDDPYRIHPDSTPDAAYGPGTGSAAASGRQRSPANPARMAQVALWTLFALCLAANAVGSLVATHVLVDAAFGAAALAFLAAAIVHYRTTLR